MNQSTNRGSSDGSTDGIGRQGPPDPAGGNTDNNGGSQEASRAPRARRAKSKAAEPKSTRPSKRRKATDGVRPQDFSDAIAQNPKDVDGSPAPAADAPGPYPAWPANRYPPSTPSLTEILTSVLGYKGTLLLVFTLVSAPLLVLIWTQIVLRYEARAEIRVRPIIPRLVFSTEENGMIPLYDAFVNTQVSVVRSQTVLQRTLDQEKVRQTTWYTSPSPSLLDRLRGEAPAPMERLRDGLVVQPRSRTEIVDVSLAAESAADARLIVDTVLQEYMKYVGERSDDTEAQLYQQLVDQYEALQKQIQSSEQMYAKLCQELGTDSPQALVTAHRVRLDATQARLGDLRNRITLLEWELQQSPVADSNGLQAAPGPGPEAQARYYADPEWLRLNTNVQTIEQEIAARLYRPVHPARIRLQSELDFARGLLRERQTQLDRQWRAQQEVAALAPLLPPDANSPERGAGPGFSERELARAKREEQLLTEELQQQQATFVALLEKARLLESEDNALRYKRQLFEAVRERRDQKSIERNVPASIDVATWAYSASRPVNDRRILFTVMALIVGLGMGGGTALWRASGNEAIRASHDTLQSLQVPLLGYVPWVRGRERSGLMLGDSLEPNPPLVEPIRVLRTTLLSRIGGKPGSTVLVTSACEGTGKSSFTHLLGQSAARAGRKVLLIDADLYKMSLSERLDLLGKPGLRDGLSGSTLDALPIFPTKIPGLDIMPAGRRENGDAICEGIANGALRAYVGQLCQQQSYDLILLDSPPVLPVADAVILANQVDSIILVERESVSRRTDVEDALTRLRATGAQPIGTVLVGSGRTASLKYAPRYGPGTPAPTHSYGAISQEHWPEPCPVADLAGTLRSLALRSLTKMYDPEKQMFVFRLRKDGEREVGEGVSRRYTAIALIGLAGEDREAAAAVLGPHSRAEVCGRLLADLEQMNDLGEVALAVWAARALRHPQARAAARFLRRMAACWYPYPTIELAWALTALTIDPGKDADFGHAKLIASALLASFSETAGLFRRWSDSSAAPKHQGHVSCFANLVYPIQALSYYHRATGDRMAGEIASRCARHMCQLQGPAGQWWWHYDNRTGRVIERYPVYSVHQHSMAPMALFALARACGQDHSAAIEKGLRWLVAPPEKSGSPMDVQRGIIWRKVARREPGSLVRGLQAGASYLHPDLRVPATDLVFPPVAIDYECRPYEMGWILHTWPAGRAPSVPQAPPALARN